MKVFIILLTLISKYYIYCFPNGGELSGACLDMEPRHGSYIANKSIPSFNIYIDNLFKRNGFSKYEINKPIAGIILSSYEKILKKDVNLFIKSQVREK
jgi:hypothetical protein